jgi:hypothetical protein
MRKNICFITILFLFSCLIAGSAETIQPFGDFLWNDNFDQILSKVNQTKCDQKIFILDSLSRLDIIGVSSTKDLLKKINSDSKIKSRLLELGFKRYVDDMCIRLIFNRAKISLYPIEILGIPFQLDLEFLGRGALEKNKENAAFAFYTKKNQSSVLTLEEKGKKIFLKW